MTTLAPEATHPSSKDGWFSACENWMDRRGKGAWIAAMILGFIFFWPLGLALLFYMIWSDRMFSKSHSCSRSKSFYRRDASSGNAAFDAYKADTLRRLEEEQQQFEAFMDRLRAAKDQSEFDEFMKDRSRKTEDKSTQAEA
ncbi:MULTISPECIES: DUF2852 domain-containing protein [Planktomarina]|jgi:hypothetical protein|uniref:DUF2852 domain-containing protein n=1 Tax=Planktomarina TaxID=1284657 RepID=UPI001D391C35|nr:DUF2852 domain-containing protein [Planktomarina temperata]MBT6020001.1 DUF2852 domain-containing protein [Planktomarina temperata]MBT7999122.1 DUF2852 domain-containing protein [Planktomarina temperata]MCH1531681.1 DUF2852 domain-containing protein [Planktomarina temperata]MDA7449168.1 DUF2852 domain-containing protein [Planktomarina temperata]